MSNKVNSNNPVATALQEVLRAKYSLFLQKHNYHWNIEGARFHSLHIMFEEQYNELFKAIDVVAEHIRALGEYALPFEDETILKYMTDLKNPLKEEDSAEKRSYMMVDNLIKLNNTVIDTCQKAKEAAVKAEDDETEDLMIERITHHKEVIWMLTSINKK